MTVKREQQQLYDAPVLRVLAIVRAVLAEGWANYTYRGQTPVEFNGSWRIDTKIIPRYWILLATKMIIQIDPDQTGTLVTVKTRSQWFLLGDVLDYYGGYIRDLLWAVGKSVPPRDISGNTA